MNIAKTVRRWFTRKDDSEEEFHIPAMSKDNDYQPPAVQRHYRAIKEAMERKDYIEVGNRQRRLAKLGVEVPTKLSHVNELLEFYNASQTRN